MSSNSWNNETNSVLTIITPPSLMFPTCGPKIFLAGSIDGGKAPPWQQEVIKYTEKNWTDSDVMILNPRRDVKRFTQKMETEQHAWGIAMLETSDYILMHLAGGKGVSPVSLLELGLYMRSDKLFLSMDADYPRKYVVDVHYTHYTKRPIYDHAFKAISAIKNDWIQKQGRY